MIHANLPKRAMPAMVETCFAIEKESFRYMMPTKTSRSDPLAWLVGPLVSESSVEVSRKSA